MHIHTAHQFVRVKRIDGDQCSSAHARRIVYWAAAIGLVATGASATPISVIRVSETVPHPYFERTAMRVPEMLRSGYIVRHDVKDRAIRQEGNDALAIGLLDRTYPGDWPYYGYGDYYGSGDFYAADAPWCYRQLRCRQ
jgi:hypothetical protein